MRHWLPVTVVMSPKPLREPSVKTSVHLSARQREGLSALSERTLIPVTRLIRVAIDHLLAHPEGTIRAVQRERLPPQG
jgi:hypothetical protein